MPKFWNIVKANAEIEAAHVAADALLTTAKITVLKVDGKDVSASEAPLAIKIGAIQSLEKSGDKTQDVSELIATNGQLAAQVESLEAANVKLTATQSAHVQKISVLESDLATAQASVTSLTSEKTELTHRLEASNKEAVRLTGQVNAANQTISEYALKADCLALTDKDGKPLAKDAGMDARLEAANKVPVAEKLTSIFGAVNAAVAKTGVSLFALPDAPPTAHAPKKELTGRARFVAAGVAQSTQTK